MLAAELLSANSNLQVTVPLGGKIWSLRREVQ